MIISRIDTESGKYLGMPTKENTKDTNKTNNPQILAAEQWLLANPTDPKAAAVRAKLNTLKGK
jgi:hypothetical protein